MMDASDHQIEEDEEEEKDQLYEYNICKKKMFIDGVLQERIYRDNSTQMSPRRDDEPDDYAGPDNRTKIEQTECGVCLQNYCDTRPMIIQISCAHVMCAKCALTLESKNTSQFFKCPFCRSQTARQSWVTLRFRSAEVFCNPERLKYRRELNVIRAAHIAKILARIDGLICEESQIKSNFALPLYCSKQSVTKRRSELLGKLTLSKIEFDLRKVRSMIKSVDMLLYKMFASMLRIPRHLSYDHSAEVAKCILYVMKKSQAKSLS